jgi:uncharacterized protein YjbJ (UPF0337 family)
MPAPALASAEAGRLADLKRIASQIVAVQLDQVESVQEHAGVVAPIADAIEAWHSIVVTGDGLAIDDAGPRAQSGHRLDDQREAVGEIVARPAHLGAVLARDDTEAVTLDFVQTHPAGRRRLGFHRETRHDKSGRAEHAYTRPGDNGGGSLVQARCAKSSRLAGIPSLFSPVIRSAAFRCDWNLLRRAPLTTDWLNRRSPVHLVTGGDQSKQRQKKERVMDWNRLEGNWKQFKGNVKEKWGRLTDDDLDVINGRQDQLEGKIQERYGLAKDQAKKDVNAWFKTLP